MKKYFFPTEQKYLMLSNSYELVLTLVFQMMQEIFSGNMLLRAIFS